MYRELGRCLALLTLFLCTLPLSVLAYVPQPVELVIILQQAPPDVAVSLITEAGAVPLSGSRVASEVYFVFHYADIDTNSELTLRIAGGGSTYEQILGSDIMPGSEGIITLDFAARTAMSGKPVSRSIVLVSRRLLAILVVRGLLSFMFGFRQRRSWLVFLVLTLLTQGWIHLSLDSRLPLVNYLITPLIGMGLVALVAELAGVLLFLKEHRRSRRLAFVLVANIISIVLGGYLISVLPV